MPSFAAFSNVLPDPAHKIGASGEIDVNGSGVGFPSVMVASVQPLQKSVTNAARRQTVEGLDHRWEISINYNKLTCEEFHPIFAFLLYRQVTMDPFFVSLPQYANQTTTDKTTEEARVRKDSTVLVTDDAAPLVGELFIADNHTKAYKVTRVETNTDYYDELGQPGAGQLRLHFTPSFQRAVPSGTILSFTDPLIQVIQSGDVQETALDKDNLFSYGVKLEEVLV